MRIPLLGDAGRFYKANLHCHSTISDGKLTPEQLKETFLEKGYSVLCYTDHEVFIPHHAALSDEHFVALNGYEWGVSQGQKVTDPAAVQDEKVCHLCAIAKDPMRVIQPLWHRTKYTGCGAEKSRPLVQFDPSRPDVERDYSPACINAAIRTLREEGFFVTYNHPTWSMEDYRDYGHYEGMDAMEMVNYSSKTCGYPEYNARVYDDLLRQGKRLYCVATDDNHSTRDAFGGFTMIRAAALTYTDIIAALERGTFYASEGPQISDLYYDSETHTVTLQTPGAAEICMISGKRKMHRIAAAPGQVLAQAVFPIEGGEGYVRFTVTDAHGLHADTNAYYPREWEAENV